MKLLTRVIYIFAALCSCSISTMAQPTASLIFPGSKSANVGIVVRDLANDSNIVVRNADTRLTPASILKCVTAAAVLLGNKETDNFNTEVYATGDILADSLLVGDLIIHAVADPTIDSCHFPEYAGFTDSIVANIKQLGIKRIAGFIDIDSTSVGEQGPGSKWELDDLKYYYGAGLYPINIRDNTIAPDRAMHNPVKTFMRELTEKLRDNGIVADNNEVNFGEVRVTPVYTHRSPTNSMIMRNMIEVSNNLFAESMLRTLAPGATVADALASETALLSAAGLNTAQLTAFDGSGLTRANSATPNFMADLLSTMANSPKADLYVSLFPKVGEEGTVKKVLRDTRLSGKIALKSGSMRGVLCYAGYKLNDEGKPTHAIVIMVNGFTCGAATLRKAIGNYLLKLF